ncbi:hypothetical protein BpHYR1_010052 [Brachionus plicatilis]|uniref:Uncharacterized protein n=1 Tax=Brachionus plicatilis TaxID=10195 RepID=A0A3M7R982_BRAPC|nr:hypothetical protein BpHYR1_010052 [Brachionus plicatilis]
MSIFSFFIKISHFITKNTELKSYFSNQNVEVSATGQELLLIKIKKSEIKEKIWKYLTFFSTLEEKENTISLIKSRATTSVAMMKILHLNQVNEKFLVWIKAKTVKALNGPGAILALKDSIVMRLTKNKTFFKNFEILNNR